MPMQSTFIKILIFIEFICLTLTHPAFQKDSTNRQSIDYFADKKRIELIPDAAETIEQVQKLIKADPTLPRLTKGEIKDLFEQITKEEIEKNDVQRGNNMRALMLVLPYNTENTTDEVLQELYTRPPITKVIESYSSPQPQTFHTSFPSTSTSNKVEIIEVGNLAATTYKPYFRLKGKTNVKPTTYHPPKPILKPFEPKTHKVHYAEVPITSLPLLPDIEKEGIETNRYSSSYNAKDADWSLLEGEFKNNINFNQKFTPMPDLAGIFKTMGLDQVPKKLKINQYLKDVDPPISSSIRQTTQGNLDIVDFTRTLPPRPRLEAYSEFKPLNIGEEIRIKPDIEDYLNRFGIVNRKRKQIKPEDIGDSKQLRMADKFKENAIKRIDTDISDITVSTFQPEDNDQYTKLLNNLKELQNLNISLTSSMLKSVQNSSLDSSSNSVLDQVPDPLITTINESTKNDLKRQNSGEVSGVETNFKFEPDSIKNAPADSQPDNMDVENTTSLQIENGTETSTSEPRNGLLADLEDSFGGPDPVTEDPSPPPKKNGFYFLADWNSFLEVGEAGNDQVVVRFDPKIGDPRRFLKVTVP